MVNEDLLGAIEVGVSKGIPSESIMSSLYNAGYLKEDIEWAFKAFKISNLKNSIGISGSENVSLPSKAGMPASANSAFVNSKKFETKQNVSDYESKIRFSDRVILFVLIGSLVFLSGLLAAVFFFRYELVDWINSFFA